MPKALNAPITSEQETPETSEQETPETYPAHVVKELREENAKYRHRAKDSTAALEGVQRDLFNARVKLDGRLADPAALDFSPELLEGTALEDKITAMLDANPRLGSRAVSGNVGQGGNAPAAFDLIDFIKGV